MADITEVEENNLVAHFRRELKLIGETDEEWISALIKIAEIFSSMGHSGMSAVIFTQTLSDLLSFKNLSPLTNNPDEWMQIYEEMLPDGLPNCWQNVRNSEAFSNDGGKTYYLLSEGGNMKNPSPTHTSEEYKKS